MYKRRIAAWIYTYICVRVWLCECLMPSCFCIWEIFISHIITWVNESTYHSYTIYKWWLNDRALRLDDRSMYNQLIFFGFHIKSKRNETWKQVSIIFSLWSITGYVLIRRKILIPKKSCILINYTHKKNDYRFLRSKKKKKKVEIIQKTYEILKVHYGETLHKTLSWKLRKRSRYLFCAE